MRFHTLALSFAALSILASACSAAPSSDDGDALSADELTAMAAPGVDENALNRAVDPCTDFYEFACGSYIASLPADTQYDVRSFTQLGKSNDAVLAQVMDAIQTAPRSEAERLAGVFYKSCMATPDAAKDSQYATGFRAEIESAKTPDALARLAARMQKRSINVFFAFIPGPDSHVRGRHGAANVFPGGYDWSTDYTNDDARTARLKVLTAGVAAAEPSLATEEVTRIATAALTIEQTLSKLGGNVFDPAIKSHPVGQAGLEAAAPNFDWKSFFETLGRTDLGDFPVDQLDYFAALDGLLTTTSSDDIHAYMTARWYETLKRDAPTVQSCQQQVEFNMADAIEPRFLELAGVDSRAQAKARALFRAIVDSFGEELKNESFLDVSTRVEAQVKLGKMRGAIGASRKLDTFTDVELDVNAPFAQNNVLLQERTFERGLAQVGKALPLLNVEFPAPIVNASYDGALNKINVPGGILGGYFFSAASPNLANFAAIGSVLGHELTHGFDNNGRQLDGDGVSRDWWSPSVADAFKSRAQCLVDEYSAFPLPGVTDPVTGQTPAHLNGQQTLPENIADNGGLKTAYRASKVEGMKGPVVAGFTPAQQFFVSFGQLWCGKRSPQVEAYFLTQDVHSTEKARVNVTLSNFDAFAAAFQCQAGSPMAPANRCGVW
jgi:predicted metalloendopeptidase